MTQHVIIGAGFAGLAAAVDLVESGLPVTVLERRSFAGGRAYSIVDRTTGDSVDNGQHLLMGCYRQTLAFLTKIGAIDNLRFQPNSRVDFLHSIEGTARFRCPRLPAPWHLLVGLIRLGTIDWRDRLAAVRLARSLRSQNSHSTRLADLTVREWLDELAQPLQLQERFWNPMALATLNEAPDRASADMFARVIEEAFLGTRQDSQLVMSRVGLSDLYTHQAQAFIEARGGRVLFNTEVTRIEFSGSRATAVMTRGGDRLVAETITTATPPHALDQLLPPDIKSNLRVFQDLTQFEYSPIVSINLWYDRTFTDREFVSLLDSPIDWVFNKNVISGSNGSRQHLALVISGARAVAKLTKEELIALGDTEVRRFFSGARAAQILHSFVVREYEATIAHTVGVARIRPAHRTPIENFFLAGDWTDTGLPATIESAVLSGRTCADSILKSRKEPMTAKDR